MKQSITCKAAFFLLSILSHISFAQITNASHYPALQYHQTDFDSDSCCWRKLAKEKKYLDAAQLIVTYLKPMNLKPGNLSIGKPIGVLTLNQKNTSFTLTKINGEP
jgi:hypothetical protein